MTYIVLGRSKHAGKDLWYVYRAEDPYKGMDYLARMEDPETGVIASVTFEHKPTLVNIIMASLGGAHWRQTFWQEHHLKTLQSSWVEYERLGIPEEVT